MPKLIPRMDDEDSSLTTSATSISEDTEALTLHYYIIPGPTTSTPKSTKPVPNDESTCEFIPKLISRMDDDDSSITNSGFTIHLVFNNSVTYFS